MTARDIRFGRRGGNWVADEASRRPPACKTCGQPMLRSTHGFGLCPDAVDLGAGPEMMHLTVDGWHDGPVRVVSRTRLMTHVVTEAGSRLTVEAHLLTRLDRTAARRNLSTLFVFRKTKRTRLTVPPVPTSTPEAS